MELPSSILRDEALSVCSRSALRWRDVVQDGLPWFNSVSDDHSYFVNGFIYCKFRTPDTFHDKGKQCFLAFDVHHKHFTVFNLSLMPSHVRIIFNTSFTVFGQFEGRIALACAKATQFKTVLEVWALEDHQNSIWRMHKIDMRDELGRCFYKVTPIGNFPSVDSGGGGGYDVTSLDVSSFVMDRNDEASIGEAQESFSIEEKHSENPRIKAMAEEMEIKFKNYWQEDYSPIASMAVVLDPRYKLKLVSSGRDDVEVVDEMDEYDTVEYMSQK
ncbi:hypothetical protein CQW23_23440 [Capsicum baccatum]|uniref:F-box associated domain-containing protein n=1 Tax=Capsicum baccatum TaxID=33114 RepID=A0A2G2VRY9_CAPBA|nr:hypothetical protein CQW23_23440 [Capsicum baccatum]